MKAQALGWFLLFAVLAVAMPSMAIFFDELDIAHRQHALMTWIGWASAVALTGGQAFLLHQLVSTPRHRFALAGVWLVVAASSVLMVAAPRAALMTANGSIVDAVRQASTLQIEWAFALGTAVAIEAVAGGIAMALAGLRHDEIDALRALLEEEEAVNEVRVRGLEQRAETAEQGLSEALAELETQRRVAERGASDAERWRETAVRAQSERAAALADAERAQSEYLAARASAERERARSNARLLDAYADQVNAEVRASLEEKIDVQCEDCSKVLRATAAGATNALNAHSRFCPGRSKQGGSNG